MRESKWEQPDHEWARCWLTLLRLYFVDSYPKSLPSFFFFFSYFKSNSLFTVVVTALKKQKHQNETQNQAGEKNKQPTKPVCLTLCC